MRVIARLLVWCACVLMCLAPAALASDDPAKKDPASPGSTPASVSVHTKSAPADWKPWPSPAPVAHRDGALVAKTVLDGNAAWVRERIPVIAGIDPKASDKKTRVCRAFIDFYAKREGQRIAEREEEELWGPGRNLMEAEVSNPVLFALGAWESDENTFRTISKAELRRALSGLQEGQWPAWVHVAIARCQVAVGRAQRVDDVVREGSETLRKWVPVMVCTEKLPESDLMHVAPMFFDIAAEDPDWDAWGAMCEELEGCKDCANPYLRDLIVGTVRMERAWVARGSGFAPEVTDKGWDGFASNLRLAREHLVRAHAQHPERPQAAAKLIRVAMGEGPGGPYTERFWFDQAIAAQFDYRAAYAAYAFALNPRWNGSLEEMRDFALECYKTGKFETETPFMMPLVVRSMAKDLDHDFSFLATDTEFGDAIIDIERRELARRKSPVLRNRASVDLTSALWWGGRYEDLYTQMSTQDFRIAEDQERRLFWRLQNEDVVFDAVLYGMKPEIRAVMESSDEFAGRGEWPGAIERVVGVDDPAFTGPLKLSKPAQAQVSRAVADRVALLRMCEAIDAGGWAKLTQDSAGSGWRVWYGELKKPAAAIPGLMTFGTDKELAFGFCPIPFGSRVRMHGKMDLSQLVHPEDAPATVYLLHNPDRDRYCMPVNFYPKSQTIEIVPGDEVAPTRQPAKIPAQFTFDIILWDEIVWVRINEEEPVRFDLVMPRRREPGPYVGLGSTWTACGSVGFGDVEATILTEKPVELGQ